MKQWFSNTWIYLTTWFKAQGVVVKAVILGLVAVILVLLFTTVFAANAEAAALPGTFTATPVATTSPGSVKLDWSVPGASACTASGSWTGTKAASGSQVLAGITTNASYTLSCVKPGAADTQASITWVPPTQNTDGSALTDLAGYTLWQTLNGGAVTSQDIAADKTALTLTNLPVGVYSWNMTATNKAGAKSDASNTASKTIVAVSDSTFAQTVAFTVSTKPKPPTGLTLVVTATTAFDVKFDLRKFAFVKGNEVGDVPMGTGCAKAFRVSGDYYAVPVKSVSLTSKPRSVMIVAQCGAA